MSVWRRAPSSIPAGVYDEVVSEALAGRLEALAPTHRLELSDLVKDSDVDEQLVTLVRDAARFILESRSDAHDKVAIARELLTVLARHGSFRPGEIELRDQLLRAVHAGVVPERPRGSLLSSGLITNAHGESVLTHLRSEFESADRIDLLCSFIKLSGLDAFRAMIERHRGRRLRVLTTTYMRATEQKAIELLQRLGAEVRISYDDTSTRLHAKAWLFHRDSEYSTAYVGSSNLSHAAQTEGLEWNVRIAEADQPDLLGQMRDVFESYWADADRFEPFDGSEIARDRLRGALAEPTRAGDFLGFDLEPKEWQKPILRELEAARAAGRDRNLVVAATGTGKTLVAAFDYARLLRAGAVESLLFVAHRKEILEQARRVFRNVLRRPEFGERWVDGERPRHGTHVFASIQSLDGADLDPSRFDHVIVDEVHHAAATSYSRLLDRLRPKQLVGLTATPERADGRLYERHFPRPYVGNLRVWDAIQRQVLVPFRYFVLDVEGVDLSEATWRGGYIDSDLSARLISAQDFWVRAITAAITDRIARPKELRAIAFCVDKQHARVVAERLSRLGLAARALTDESPGAERDSARADLASGKLQVLCVVDLFNEGVDLPEVNTLFLLRPTESSTVFLQQLGRGLRRSPGKDILTVLDATGRQHPSFRSDRHLRELLGHSPRELREFLETGAGRLPSGCTLEFEERAGADILERVKRSIPTRVDGLRELLRSHRDAGWSLQEFLSETEVDLLDLYRDERSWTSLREDAGIAKMGAGEEERAALSKVSHLLHVTDSARLSAWARLLDGEAPTTEIDRRLAAMLLAVLYGNFVAAELPTQLARFAAQPVLRAELRELLPVLQTRGDSLSGAQPLTHEIPLVLHARYLDLELAAAFHTVATTSGKYRRFYTGVEPVADRRFDLLLVTLDKGDQKQAHLKYADFPLGERRFQWQSKADTRADSESGLRHLEPKGQGVTPLLFVREAKKDARRMTNAFRFLGPVEPVAHRGERPITIEWSLQTPLRDEWVRNWGAA